MLKQQWKSGQLGRMKKHIETLLFSLSIPLIFNQRLSCDHLALGCGDPQWRTGAAEGTGD